MSNEFGYIPESPEQSFGNNKGIFTPNDIYDLTRADKYTNYGQLELIETQTFSTTVSVVDFLDIKSDIYNVHFMTFNNMKTAGDNQEVTNVRLYENGVLESGSVYQRATQRATNVPGLEFGESRSTGDTRFNNIFGTGTATGESVNGYMYFYNLGDSTKYSFVTAQVAGLSSNAQYMGAFGSGVLPQASFVDGIQVKKNSGNYSDFSVSLYGIKEYS